VCASAGQTEEVGELMGQRQGFSERSSRGFIVDGTSITMPSAIMMAHWLWRGGAVAVDADQLLRALEAGNGQRVDAVGRGVDTVMGKRQAGLRPTGLEKAREGLEGSRGRHAMPVKGACATNSGGWARARAH